MGGLDNGGQRDRGRGKSVSCRKIECDGTRKSGRDKRSEHLIERLKEGESRGYGGGGGCRTWMRGWMRGGTLKECQSDFQCVLFPPLLVTSWVGFRDFGGNNDAEARRVCSS